jgi:hypothetical protein
MLQKTQPVNDFCELGQELYAKQNKPVACHAGLPGGKSAK